MIIFLYGKDTYRLQRKVKEIEDRYQKIHQTGLNLEKLDASEIEFKDFWDKLQQTSMFVKKKLFFLESLFSNQIFKEEFLKKIKDIADSGDVVVVVEKEQMLHSDKLFSCLKKHSKSQEFKPLLGRQLVNWVKKEFENCGVKIEERTSAKLIDFVGNDSWLLSTEIKKLVCFRALAKEINDRDVELLIKPKTETAIFEMIDALAARNKKKALRLLQKHLEKGDSPLYLLKMINFQFRNLLLLKSQRQIVPKELDMHPYVFRKTLQQMTRFSFDELKKIYQRIFEVDLNIKTGKISSEQGIKWLVAQI